MMNSHVIYGQEGIDCDGEILLSRFK